MIPYVTTKSQAKREKNSNLLDTLFPFWSMELVCNQRPGLLKEVTDPSHAHTLETVVDFVYDLYGGARNSVAGPLYSKKYFKRDF